MGHKQEHMILVTPKRAHAIHFHIPGSHASTFPLLHL
jgi:hypothetical protein